jgi:hypothetical protein
MRTSPGVRYKPHLFRQTLCDKEGQPPKDMKRSIAPECSAAAD